MEDQVHLQGAPFLVDPLQLSAHFSLAQQTLDVPLQAIVLPPTVKGDNGEGLVKISSYSYPLYLAGTALLPHNIQ
jgi:hypothetical protein